MHIPNLLAKKRDGMALGQHEIEWDATDGDGNSVSTGIYFVRLLTEKYVKSQKIILLR